MRRARLIVVGLGVLLVATLVASHPARSGPRACSHGRVHIEKHSARLTLICDEGTSTYPVTFGAAPVGHKRKRGDERTPEGTYKITAKSKAERFHRFLKLSYPNEEDRRRATRAGLDPGSGIGIHGVRTSLAALARLFIRSAGQISSRAWGPTDGCVGMINEDVEVVFDALQVGAEVRIDP
jgi:murein L,D-transpeptidase YafK